MKNFISSVWVLVLLLMGSGNALANNHALRQTIPPPKNLKVSVTSTDCVKGLEALRLKGLKEMQARRAAALAKAKLLPTNKARTEAVRKAQDAYNAEMKVAAKQLEAAKALCKKPTLSPQASQKKTVVPPLKKSVPFVPLTKPAAQVPKPTPTPIVKPPAELLKPPALPDMPPKEIIKEIVVVPPKPTPPADVSVEISNFAFNPSTLKVKKGTTVIWTNKDGTSHTVTSDTNQFSSDFLGTGQSFRHTFDKTGSFQYHCQPHRNMIATVEVVE